LERTQSRDIIADARVINQLNTTVTADETSLDMTSDIQFLVISGAMENIT